MSDLTNCKEKRPLASKIREPLGLGPYPSTETIVQLPTSCLLLTCPFGALSAVLADNPNPNTVTAVIQIMLRRFIGCLLGCSKGQYPPIRSARLGTQVN